MVILVAAYAATFAGLTYLTWRGFSYYSTPLLDRPRHPDYWLLKPGGSLGHAFGVTGAALMTLMHLYSLRKRSGFLRNFGRLPAWLDFHIYCGLTGPLFIVLHSSLKVQGLVSVSFWSMVAVVSSGVLGRFLYLQIPRRRTGTELTFEELGALASQQSSRLEKEFRLSAEQLQSFDELVSDFDPARRSLLATAVRLPFEHFRLRAHLHRLCRDFGELPRQTRIDLHRLTLARAQLRRKIVTLQRMQELFHYWHVFHKPFAVIMYIFMVVHIGVAVATGYGWGPP